MPVIWATRVLESLAKTDVPSPGPRSPTLPWASAPNV